MKKLAQITILLILGQILLDSDRVSVSEFETTKIQKNNVALLVQVTLENGAKVTKKIVF